MSDYTPKIPGPVAVRHVENGGAAAPAGNGDRGGEGKQAAGEAAGMLPLVQDLKRMLADVHTVLSQMQGKLEGMERRVEEHGGRLDAHGARLEEHATRLEEAERRIGETEDEVRPWLKRICALEKLAAENARRLAEQEGRARRNNIRVVGLAEGSDPRNLEPYMEGVIRGLLPGAHLSPHFLLERAHRSLAPQPPPGAPPRPVICRVLNYRDRDVILAEARSKGQLKHDGNPVSIFPDYTAAVQRQRRKFAQVKQVMRDKGIRYSMFFPARLRIQHDGSVYFFTEPQDALDYVEHRMNAPMGVGRNRKGPPVQARRRLKEVPGPGGENLMQAGDAHIAQAGASARIEAVIEAWASVHAPVDKAAEIAEQEDGGLVASGLNNND